MQTLANTGKQKKKKKKLLKYLWGKFFCRFFVSTKHSNTHTMNNLNANESAVLECIQIEAKKSTGGEFTYFDDVLKSTWIGSIMTPAQFKGYLSQLQKKGYLMVEDADQARPKQIFNIAY